MNPVMRKKFPSDLAFAAKEKDNRTLNGSKYYRYHLCSEKTSSLCLSKCSNGVAYYYPFILFYFKLALVESKKKEH